MKIGKSTTWRYLTKKVPRETGGGFTTQSDGGEWGEMEVFVDVDALVKAIGAKALASKKGVSKLQGGAVMVKVVRRWRTERS